MELEYLAKRFQVIVRARARVLTKLLFELNDDISRARLQGMCEVLLDDIINDGRLEIICDTTNNTPEVVDRNSIVVALVYNKFMNLGAVCSEQVYVTGFRIDIDGFTFIDNDEKTTYAWRRW